MILIIHWLDNLDLNNFENDPELALMELGICSSRFGTAGDWVCIPRRSALALPAISVEPTMAEHGAQWSAPRFSTIGPDIFDSVNGRRLGQLCCPMV